MARPKRLNPPPIVRTSLRISPDLKHKIEQLAKREHRSAHAQMTWILETAVADAFPPPVDGWIPLNLGVDAVDEDVLAASINQGIRSCPPRPLAEMH